MLSSNNDSAQQSNCGGLLCSREQLGAHLHEAKTPALVLTYGIAGDVAETELKLLLPLEPLARAVAAAGAGAPSALPETLREVSVEIAVHLGGATIALRDLLALEPGDVIPLEASPSTPVSVEVEGRPVGRGRLGVVDRTLAVSLESVPPSGPLAEFRP